MHTPLARSCFGNALAFATLVLAPLSLHSAEPPRPSTPVTVEGTVTVQGIVEEINDVLRQPFVKSASSGDPSTSPTIAIDIPDGKRLVIESIAFQASTPTNEPHRMFFQPLVNGQRLLVPLAVQFSSVEGAVTYLIGSHPLKIRLDSAGPGVTNEIQIRRGTGSNGTLNATVFGYLVDIGQ